MVGRVVILAACASRLSAPSPPSRLPSSPSPQRRPRPWRSNQAFTPIRGRLRQRSMRCRSPKPVRRAHTTAAEHCSVLASSAPRAGALHSDVPAQPDSGLTPRSLALASQWNRASLEQARPRAGTLCRRPYRAHLARTPRAAAARSWRCSAEEWRCSRWERSGAPCCEAGAPPPRSSAERPAIPAFD
jgi:hypothetical protein